MPDAARPRPAAPRRRCDQLTIDQVEGILGAGGVDLSALAEQASQVPPAPDATA